MENLSIEEKLKIYNTSIEVFCAVFCDNDTNFSCEEEEFLLCHRGYKILLPIENLWPVTIIMLVILLTGLLGNFAVCMVIVKNHVMRTTTNFYLFSLAVSDLLLLIFGLPEELWKYWHLYPYEMGIVMCKLTRFFTEAASYASVMTIVSFSLERYLAICHPLRLRIIAGPKRALPAIGAIWAIAALCALPFAYYNNVTYLKYPPDGSRDSPESAVCGVDAPPWNLLEISSGVFFFIPMIVLLIVYSRIAICIRSRYKHTSVSGIKGRMHYDKGQNQNKTVIRMLGAVVVAFIICWAPFHFQRLANSKWENPEIKIYVYIVTGVFYYMEATINPILYNIMSNRYRVAFKKILCANKENPSQNSLQPSNCLLMKEQSKGIFKLSTKKNSFYTLTTDI